MAGKQAGRRRRRRSQTTLPGRPVTDPHSSAAAATAAKENSSTRCIDAWSLVAYGFLFRSHRRLDYRIAWNLSWSSLESRRSSAQGDNRRVDHGITWILEKDFPSFFDIVGFELLIAGLRSFRFANGNSVSMDEALDSAAVAREDSSIGENAETSLGGGGRDGEGEVWASLPDHLTQAILAKLPVRSVLRCGAVCKSWRALTSGAAFFADCARAAPAASERELPLFLLYTNHVRRNFPVYDPAASAWLLMPRPRSSSPSFLAVVAASGGLALLAREDGDLGLVVVNPVTKAYRALHSPAMPLSSLYVIGMVALGESYQILMAGKGNPITVLVYDSAVAAWRQTGSIHESLALVFGGAHAGGALYCLAYGVSVTVLAYSLDAGTWEAVRAPLPAPILDPELFESGGRVRLAALWAQGVCVWQLDYAKTKWTHLLTVPNAVLQEPDDMTNLGLMCSFVARGDVVCVVCHRHERILMCNVEQKTWWLLPRCPWLPPGPIPERGGSWSFSGFPLQPRLDASV